MSKGNVHIYVNPLADITTYPDDLLGDMSVFKSARTIQHEAQWIFYLMLKDQGLDVDICRDYPEDGIFVIHKANARKFVWNPNLFVVSLQWDYKRDDRAQMHLVGNKHKATSAALGRLDRLSCKGHQHYVTPIMHPVVIPRDPSRGALFENIAFIGDPKNLDEAFRTETFEAQLKELGMKFIVRGDPGKMADFSDIDVVIAVRRIGQVISNKPPVKLINSWRGGVPALLGCEVGFREIRENEYDFIEIDSVQSALEALTRLKNDVDFRGKMITNAQQRAIPFSAEGQQQTWIMLMDGRLWIFYVTWQHKNPNASLLQLTMAGLRICLMKSCRWKMARL